jgi:hypothetical protein
MERDVELLRALLAESATADREQATALVKMASEISSLRSAVEGNTAAATACASSRELDARARTDRQAADTAREQRWQSRLDAVLSATPVQWLSVLLLLCVVVQFAMRLGVWEAIEPFAAHALGRCP